MELLALISVGVVALSLGVWLGLAASRSRHSAQQQGRAFARALVMAMDGDLQGAIDELTTRARGGLKSADAHFALGSLFRARGDLERSTRIHQALVMRRDLDRDTAIRAKQQLAKDLAAARFPKKALALLQRAIRADRKNPVLLRELARLHEEIGQWEEAAETQQRLAKATGIDTVETQAHLWSQLAEEAIADRQRKSARRALKRALSLAPNSPHALHMLARFHCQQEEFGDAVAAWSKALSVAPELAALFVPVLEGAAFSAAKVGSISGLLDDQIAKHPDSLHLQLARARFDAKQRPDLARLRLRGLLEQHPALLPAVYELGQLLLETADEATIRGYFRETISVVRDATQGFRCRDCGYTKSTEFWRCPSCGRWATLGVIWGRRAGEGANRG